MQPTERTRVRRLPERGSYDLDAIRAVVDEALICHVGFVDAEGHPVVIPTIHTRVGDALYFHGSPASRMLRRMKGGVEVCVTVTIVDGLVLARSGFHHSMNYRSVVAFGVAEEVTDPDEQRRALDALVDHVVPGRAAAVRPTTEKERRATLLLRLPLSEASLKTRTGPPGDEPDDYDLPIWAGVLPVRTVYGPPIEDPAMRVAVPVPPHVLER